MLAVANITYPLNKSRIDLGQLFGGLIQIIYVIMQQL